MTDAIHDLLEKSAQSIDAASLLLHGNYVDFSVSRAYYAMYYAVEALLLSRERSFNKHSGGDLESSSWLAAWGARNGDRCKCRDDFGKK